MGHRLEQRMSGKNDRNPLSVVLCRGPAQSATHVSRDTVTRGRYSDLHSAPTRPPALASARLDSLVPAGWPVHPRGASAVKEKERAFNVVQSRYEMTHPTAQAL